jgi:formate dehydrogenase iron-sulfur subunit
VRLHRDELTVSGSGTAGPQADRATTSAATATPATPVTLGSRVSDRRAGPFDGMGIEGPELLPLDAGEQYRFTFAMDACVGCHSCEVACAEQNGLPVGTAWRRVGEFEGGEHPQARRFHLSMSCNHCLDPACLNGCPTDAYVKLDNGVVAHRADECIGCQYCTWNCPYSVPVFQPDRRIVTKCDMCLPRLEEGLKPACVGACPTRALDVEKVDVAAWVADHAEADAPHLPPADLTLSTTRIVARADRLRVPDGAGGAEPAPSLPPALAADPAPAGQPADRTDPAGPTAGTAGTAGQPLETVAASDFDLRPEDPHWPLVVLTLLTQVALGASLTASSPGERAAAAGLAGAGLAAAFLHLGRPWHAWKALRNLRRSWLSREALLLGLFGTLAVPAVVVPALVPVAALLGVAGVFASGRLYVVPGRPAWNTPLTIVAFFLTALATGPALTGHVALATAATGAQLAVWLVNLLRLRRDRRREWRGTVSLHRRPFLGLSLVRLALAIAGVAVWLTWALGSEGPGSAGLGPGAGGSASLGAGPGAGGSGATWAVLAGFVLVASGELVGRYLFFVTVVPLNIPGSFFRGRAGSRHGRSG